MKKMEFKKEYEKRGWTPLTLAKRWGCSNTRIHQIAAEVECNHKKANAYIDMVNGLPYIQN
jgi:hypothetical protein